MDTPWWLPTGVKASDVIIARDCTGEWRFTGQSSAYYKPTDLVVCYPMVWWDRVLSTEEIMLVYTAIKNNDIESLISTEPLHIWDGSDITTHGDCHCPVCRAHEQPNR